MVQVIRIPPRHERICRVPPADRPAASPSSGSKIRTESVQEPAPPSGPFLVHAAQNISLPGERRTEHCGLGLHLSLESLAPLQAGLFLLQALSLSRESQGNLQRDSSSTSS